MSEPVPPVSMYMYVYVTKSVVVNIDYWHNVLQIYMTNHNISTIIVHMRVCVYVCVCVCVCVVCFCVDKVHVDGIPGPIIMSACGNNSCCYNPYDPGYHIM